MVFDNVGTFQVFKISELRELAYMSTLKSHAACKLLHSEKETSRIRPKKFKRFATSLLSLDLLE